MTPAPDSFGQERKWTLSRAGGATSWSVDDNLPGVGNFYPRKEAYERVPVVEQAAYDQLKAWQEQIVEVLIAPPGKKNEDAAFARDRLDELTAPMLSSLRDQLAAAEVRAKKAEKERDIYLAEIKRRDYDYNGCAFCKKRREVAEARGKLRKQRAEQAKP